MATDRQQFKSYAEKEIYDKFKYICQKERRTASNYIEILLEKEIKEYEDKNGEIIL